MVSGGVYHHFPNNPGTIAHTLGFEIHASVPGNDGRWMASLRNSGDSTMHFVVQALCANAG